jgi:hypothetical protein
MDEDKELERVIVLAECSESMDAIRLSAEVRRLRARLGAVEAVLADAKKWGVPVDPEDIQDALKGGPATAEEDRLWRLYFENDYNAKWGWDAPKEGFRRTKSLALRCNRCAYLVGGIVHVDWHEDQPEWKTEKMLVERKEKLGE